MRKLLYHRGIDDSTATYVTDYVESAICAIYSVAIVSRGMSRDNVAVVIIQSAVSISALTGGITHQFLYQVFFTYIYICLFIYRKFLVKFNERTV